LVLLRFFIAVKQLLNKKKKKEFLNTEVAMEQQDHFISSAIQELCIRCLI